MKTKFLAALLSVSMVFTGLPMGISAAEYHGDEVVAEVDDFSGDETEIASKNVPDGTSDLVQEYDIISEKPESTFNDIVLYDTDNENHYTANNVVYDLNTATILKSQSEIVYGYKWESTGESTILLLRQDDIPSSVMNEVRTCNTLVFGNDIDEIIISVMGNENLYKVDLNRVNKIGNDDPLNSTGTFAFGRCVNLTEVINMDKLKSIAYGSFYMCEKLTTVDMPKCEYIGSMSFYDCDALTSVSLPTCERIEYYAFGKCKNLKTVDITGFDSTKGEVDSLGNHTNGIGAFRDCVSLEKVVLGEKCTELPNGIFEYYDGHDHLNVSALKIINLENVTKCRQFSLSGTSIESVSLPKCTEIERSAFAWCKNLNSIEIPLVETIGNQAFYENYQNLRIKGGSRVTTIEPGGEYEKPTFWVNKSNTYTVTLDRNASAVLKSYKWKDTNRTVKIDGTDDEQPESDINEPAETITGDTYVVNQKIDTTAEGKLGRTYEKYAVSPKGAATVSKGIVTVKKVPSDGKITITGYVKDGKKYKADKAFVLTAEKPVYQKTITLTRPYFGDVNPNDAAASCDGYSLMTGSTITPSAWTSSKPSVAAVDPSTGFITAVGKGSAKITAIYGNTDPKDKNAAKYTFTVKVNMPVINKKTAKLQSGAALSLKLSGIKKDTVITWSSSNPEAASVDPQTGKVKALAYDEATEGKTVISATLDGVAYPCYECEVSVTRPTLAKAELVLKAGKTAKITVKNMKLKVKDGAIKFTQDEAGKAFATVDETGKVKGIAAGECTITVSVAGVELPCKVTVK